MRRLEFSSVTEIRGGSRVEKRLTGGRGGVRGKEKILTRNGRFEEAGSFKKSGPIFYFYRNDYLILISPYSPSIGQSYPNRSRHLPIHNPSIFLLTLTQWGTSFLFRHIVDFILIGRIRCCLIDWAPSPIVVSRVHKDFSGSKILWI